LTRSSIVVMIIGPYRSDTHSGIVANIQAARSLQVKALSAGFTVVCPHTNTAHAEYVVPEMTEEDWYAMYRQLVRVLARGARACGGDMALLAVEGWEKSRGAVGEYVVGKEEEVGLYTGEVGLAWMCERWPR